MEKQLGIHFGAMSDKISKQLKDQEFNFDAEKVKWFDKIHDAIVLLRIQGLLTDSQNKMIQDKLFKKIIAHVKEKNKK